MTTDLPDASSESSYNVDFNAYVDGQSNRDLGGRGLLVVRATEPRFVFSGKPRGRFLIGKTAIEISFRTDQLWNVVVDGRGVQFATTIGKSGEKKAPFVFTCDSEKEAAAVAALLPPTKDADFVAGESFIEKIRQLPGANGPGSVTNLALLAIAAVFVVMGFLGAGWVKVARMEPYLRYGANYGPLTADGQWWRLVTYMFMHYGLVHLLLNAWALFQAGHIVEKLFGRALYVLIYAGSGLMGGLATLLWSGTKVSAGASGAVFGVYGALLGYLLREKHGVPAGIFRPMLRSTLLFAGYNLVFGAVHPNIDNAAHIGGFLGGLLLGWLCALPLDREPRNRLRRGRATAAVAVTLALVTVGILLAGRKHKKTQRAASLTVHGSLFAIRSCSQAITSPEASSPRTIDAISTRDGNRPDRLGRQRATTR